MPHTPAALRRSSSVSLPGLASSSLSALAVLVLLLRLGVRPSDLDRYHIPAQCRLPMTEHDLKTGRELLEEEFIQKNPAWMKELEIMVKTKEKAEIQSLSSFGFQYLSQVFLPLKIQSADWI